MPTLYFALMVNLVSTLIDLQRRLIRSMIWAMVATWILAVSVIVTNLARYWI